MFLKGMKSGRVGGSDYISVEVRKCLGERMVDVLQM